MNAVTLCLWSNSTVPRGTVRNRKRILIPVATGYIILIIDTFICSVFADVLQESRTPLAADVVANILESCKDLGLLIGKGGQNGNVGISHFGSTSQWLLSYVCLKNVNYVYNGFCR